MVAEPSSGLPSLSPLQTPPPAPPNRHRTWLLAGGIAGGAFAVVAAVVLVIAISASGPSYTYLDDLCEELDISPVTERYAVADTDHRGAAEDGRTAFRVCEFNLDAGTSDLRITAEFHLSRTLAREFHTTSVEHSRSTDPGVHAPFETIAEVAGPWQEGMLFVGDVFRSADYNVRLKVLDDNLTFQIDLILAYTEAPVTYAADDPLPLAVRQVAENVIATLTD